MVVLLQSTLVNGDVEPSHDDKEEGVVEKRDVVGVDKLPDVETELTDPVDPMVASGSSQQVSVDTSEPMLASASGEIFLLRARVEVE